MQPKTDQADGLVRSKGKRSGRESAVVCSFEEIRLVPGKGSLKLVKRLLKYLNMDILNLVESWMGSRRVLEGSRVLRRRGGVLEMIDQAWRGFKGTTI